MMLSFDNPEYMPFVIIVGFVLTVFLWMVWQGRVRPMFIPRADIERMASELIERYGDRAEETALMEEDRAWRYSHAHDQGKWRRISKELRRRADL